MQCKNILFIQFDIYLFNSLGATLGLSPPMYADVHGAIF